MFYLVNNSMSLHVLYLIGFMMNEAIFFFGLLHLLFPINCFHIVLFQFKMFRITVPSLPYRSDLIIKINDHLFSPDILTSWQKLYPFCGNDLTRSTGEDFVWVYFRYSIRFSLFAWKEHTKRISLNWKYPKIATFHWFN